MAKGIPKLIHCPKPMRGRPGNSSSHSCSSTRLGGVPTGVAMPPIEAP